MEARILDSIALMWAQRAQAELGAEIRFKILSEKLENYGAPSQIVKLAEKAKEDESRHAIMCSDVAKELGHETGYETYEGKVYNFERPWLKQKTIKDQLLCEVVLMCCITETMNASLMSSIYGNSEKNKIQKIIKEILKDEVKHSQIGWAYLASQVKDRDCGFVGDYLTYMLEISVKDELFVPNPIESGDEASFNYGVMPMSLRLGQFCDTLEQVVLPGFENFGIDTQFGKQWLLDKRK